MLKTWMKTIKEEIAAVQEEMGATIIIYVSFTLAGFFLLQMTWSRLEGAWRTWRAQRRMDGLQRRLVEEEEELDLCSICHAEYAAGDEVSPNPSFELR